jgi:hypothetical protein
MDKVHAIRFVTEKVALNIQLCVVTVAKCKQSSILTSIQNTNSL